jgi:hypothetical protein
MATPETDPVAQPVNPDAGPGVLAAAGPGTPAMAASAVSQPRWRQAVARVRHPGWSWTVGRDWLIPSAVGVATLFLGAAIGGIPALVAGSWQDPQTRIAAWSAIGLGVVGLLALLATLLIWQGRNRILRRNGTAYVFQESARGWSGDDARTFLASVGRQFARTIEVPGPGKLGGSWDWPLGAGAQDWDSQLNELVRAFQALRYDDDPGMPKGIFMWAWAPLAIAYGTRATVADRGLVLDVWQRPGKGRAGEVEIPPWSQGPHRFGRGQRSQPITSALPGSVRRGYRWPARVTIEPPAIGAGAAAGSAAIGREVPVILLVRLGGLSWGPVPDVPAEPDPDAPLTVVLKDAAGLGRVGTFRTEIRELRIVPPAGVRLFPWPAYPSLVAEVSEWIRQRTAELDGHPIMIGTILPPEVALGLGIDAGQAVRPAWPTHLWPIVSDPTTKALVVPRLNLGTAALASPIPP